MNLGIDNIDCNLLSEQYLESDLILVGICKNILFNLNLVGIKDEIRHDTTNLLPLLE